VIEEEVFGPNILVAARLNNLAQLLLQGSSHVNPEPLLRRALSIREKALAPPIRMWLVTQQSRRLLSRAKAGTRQNVSCNAPWQLWRVAWGRASHVAIT
jgi:hypothetical protein